MILKDSWPDYLILIYIYIYIYNIDLSVISSKITCCRALPTVTHICLVALPSQRKCVFCGNSTHNRKVCPARDATCFSCNNKGHFSSVCRSKHKRNNNQGTSAALYKPSLCSIPVGCPQSLSHASVSIKIKGQLLTALVDSCSSESFISESVVNLLNIKTSPTTRKISMALTTLESELLGYCTVTLTLNGNDYEKFSLGVLKNLCSDIILGYDFQKLHSNIIFPFGGKKCDLVINHNNDNICALTSAQIEIPSLFSSIPQGIKPIATKSRRFNKEDLEFINIEVSRLLTENIIEPCYSPWRAQVVVAKDPSNNTHKKRLCIDYSQTVNLHTELDAYPLPRIDEMVNKLSKYKVFSTFDLKSAYHQIPILESDKKFTAFEANGRLYQFQRIPFGVTNGVSIFQRSMDKFVESEKLFDTFPYLDNITIGGSDQAHHDANRQKFESAAKRWGLTLNESKSIISVSSIDILGYSVSHNLIKPDAECLRPLDELPPPTGIQSLRRTLGMFSYYSKWIPSFGDKI